MRILGMSTASSLRWGRRAGSEHYKLERNQSNDHYSGWDGCQGAEDLAGTTGFMEE